MNKWSLSTIVAFMALAFFAVIGWVRTPLGAEAATTTPLTPAAFTEALKPAAPAEPAAQPAAPAPAQRTVSPTRNSVRRKHERPLSHSVAIVAGSAGAGAAIGGLAGGGKGAGIGALSGGAAGLIYDRLTHKK